MPKSRVLSMLAAGVMSLSFLTAAQAQDEWKFGIGTGITSFGVDGEIGFPTGGGGAIFDVDLDNSDTADLLTSAFGINGFAAKGKWTILFGAGTATLEDEDASLEADWDKARADLAAVYRFAETGKHNFGALFGARYLSHEWEFDIAGVESEVDDDWTDAIVGFTYNFRFAEKWTWANSADYGFGDSEGSTLITSSVRWQAYEHWLFHFGIQQHSIEFGDEDDIADSDFYFYDVDEPGFTIGFLYIF